MKKLMLIILVTVFLVLAGCGSNKGNVRFTEEELEKLPMAQRSGLPEPSGGFVLSVGQETVTASEVVEPLAERFRSFAIQTDYENFSQQAKPYVQRVIASRVADIILFQMAQQQGGDQIEERLEKAIDGEVRKFVLQFDGNYAQAEQSLRDMGMNWDDFRKYKKKQILSQSFIASEMSETEPITHSDLRDYYQELKQQQANSKPSIRFQLLDIQPEKIEFTDPNSTRQAEAETLSRKLKERIKRGEDFAELAKKYSNGPRAMYGGLWQAVNPNSLTGPYSLVARKCQNMKTGQVIGPVYSAGHYFIIKLLEKNSGEIKPFAEMQKELQAQLRVKRRREAMQKLNEKILRDASLDNVDRFITFCTQKLYLQANQS